MEPWLISIIVSGFVTTVLATLGFLLKRLINEVSAKLDTVITNQNEQKVEIAEIKKDLESSTNITQSNTIVIEILRSSIQNLESKVATLIEWKRNQEKY